MTAPPDPRRHPYRPGLAAAHLRGLVAADRFVDGVPHRVRTGVAGLRGSPDASATQTSQVLFGETVTVYDRQGNWAWGQCGTDGYVGWVHAQSLSPEVEAPTHVVTALRSFLFPAPDLKTPPRDAIPLGAPVTVLREENGYMALAGGGWLYGKHLAPLDGTGRSTDPDFVATAQRLLGVPYLWGGRSPLGIDCSGLVQLALLRAGIACPRDSDMQRAEVGDLVSADGKGVAYHRGDIVFFPGHVGFMLDGRHLLHATAFTMTVTVEPLEDVVARVDPTRAGGILAVRRLAG